MTSPPFLVIAHFAKVWKQEYGEEYVPSPKDFRHAKLYLQTLDGDIQPDLIISRAKIYLKKGGVYAENCHGFTAFINNIGSFVPEKKKELPTIRTGWWTCPDCKERMLESYQATHRCVSQPIPLEPPEQQHID